MRDGTQESKDEARPLNGHDVAFFDDLVKTYSRTGKRMDQHWLAKFCLERYDQLVPALLAAVPEDDRESVRHAMEANPW